MLQLNAENVGNGRVFNFLLLTRDVVMTDMSVYLITSINETTTDPF